MIRIISIFTLILSVGVVWGAAPTSQQIQSLNQVFLSPPSQQDAEKKCDLVSPECKKCTSCNPELAKKVAELNQKLSSRTKKALPKGFVESIFYKDDKGIYKQLYTIYSLHKGKLRSPIYHEHDRHQSETLFRALAHNWAQWQPDWKKLPRETKRWLLFGYTTMFEAKPDHPSIPGVISLLSDNNPLIRTDAIWALACVRPDSATKKLAVKWLHDDNPFHRWGAIRALRVLVARDQIPAIKVIVRTDQDEQVRSAAIAYLRGVLRDKEEAYEIILDRLNDPSSVVVFTALQHLEDWDGLAKHKHKIKPFAVAHPNGAVRHQANKLLKNLNTNK